MKTFRRDGVWTELCRRARVEMTNRGEDVPGPVNGSDRREWCCVVREGVH